MERLLVVSFRLLQWFCETKNDLQCAVDCKSGSLNDIEQNVGSCKLELPSPLHKSRDLKRYVSREMVLSPIVPMTIIKSFIFQATYKLPHSSL